MPSEAKSTGRSFMWASRKKPSRVLGHLQEVRQLLVLPGHGGRAQDQQVRIEGQLFHDGRVIAGKGQLAVALCDNRRPLLVVAHEAHAGAPRLQIVLLQEPVSHHVPEEDHHVERRVGFLELQRVLYGVRAADAAAIGPLLVPSTPRTGSSRPGPPWAALFSASRASSSIWVMTRSSSPYA